MLAALGPGGMATRLWDGFDIPIGHPGRGARWLQVVLRLGWKPGRVFERVLASCRRVGGTLEAGKSPGGFIFASLLVITSACKVGSDSCCWQRSCRGPLGWRVERLLFGGVVRVSCDLLGALLLHALWRAESRVLSV